MTEQQPRWRSLWRWVLIGLALAITITWLALTPTGLLGKAQAVGYAVCHQIAERSFHINARPFPLCARCSGLFLGALLGMIFQWIQGRKGKMPPVGASIFFAILAILWVMDGVNSFTMLSPKLPSLYQTKTWTRLVTGTGMGLALSAILRPTFIQTMYKNWKNESPYRTWLHVLFLVALAGGLVGLIWLQSAWILYIFALLSVFSVIMLLTMVYSMVFVMLIKRENTYTHYRELFIPLIAGYIIALLQIGAISMVRFYLTGTWSGFSL